MDMIMKDMLDDVCSRYSRLYYIACNLRKELDIICNDGGNPRDASNSMKLFDDFTNESRIYDINKRIEKETSEILLKMNDFVENIENSTYEYERSDNQTFLDIKRLVTKFPNNRAA
jgi:hypothetical protein